MDKVDLLALPELTTIEFTKKSFENLSEVAESLDGESFSLFAELAKKHSTYISFSLPRKEQGNFYISNIVINRHGVLETYYDKIHIPKFGFPIEKNYFKRGKKACVFRVKEYFGQLWQIMIPIHLNFLLLARFCKLQAHALQHHNP